MRILIISFFTDWTTHLGVELELAQRHLDSGDEVVFLGCDGCIKACRANPHGERRVCDLCRYKRLRGIQSLSGSVGEHRLGDYVNPAMLEEADRLSSNVKTAAAAKDFRFNGHDLGWGALSSTVQVLRDPVCETEVAAELLSRFTKTALLSYGAVQAFLKQHQSFSKAYIFNGRFASTRGAFRACQEITGMEVILHERGSSNLKYSLFENDLLHTRKMWMARIEASWNAEPDISKKEEIAALFYKERRWGTAVGWKSFTVNQEAGALPVNWDSKRTNIAIFNSSEDEFAGIGDEWKNHVYEMQNEGVRMIVTDALERYPDFHFYLRMHPNLIGVENDDVARLRSIKADNFHLIEPNSSISTYALLDAADKIISFGSSVGIEATYWGKPSIMAGHSFYEHLGSVYCAEDHEDVMTLIGQNLMPCSKEGALKYGYHLRTFGDDFKYWQADDFYDGSFNGYQMKHGGRNIGRRTTLFLSNYFNSRSRLMRITNKVFDAYDKFRRDFRI
jgi:hypothetical protein